MTPQERRNIRSTILTATNQVAYCERHNLPVGAARARALIERMEQKLSAPTPTSQEAQ